MTAPTNSARAEPPRVAIVHDYFTQRGGAERVAERLARLHPNAPVFTSMVDPAAAPRGVDPARLRTSALQRWRRARIPLKLFAPVLPATFRRVDLGAVDVVLSSSSAFAHHVRPRPGVIHICYCHTPAAFLWRPGDYFGDRSSTGRLAAPALAMLRRWDGDAAGRVDIYLANSSFTARRIRANYGRDAQVVHPPIDVDAFTPTDARSGRFLVVARLRPHKALDLAVATATEYGFPLDVIGDGSDLARLQSLAGPSITFLGRRTDAEVAAAMARCEALLVPGTEDFGMTTAEVQAAGRPPVALATGGTTEIVEDGVSGYLFHEQTTHALAIAMERARREALDPQALVASARRFDAARFDRTIADLVAAATTGGGVGDIDLRDAEPAPARAR